VSQFVTGWVLQALRRQPSARELGREEANTTTTMSADPALRSESSLRQAAGPLYFKSGTRTLFGWIHRPEAAPVADLGVVICKPFGFEAICSYLSVRSFADAVSALGIPALRFDYAERIRWRCGGRM